MNFELHRRRFLQVMGGALAAPSLSWGMQEGADNGWRFVPCDQLPVSGPHTGLAPGLSYPRILLPCDLPDAKDLKVVPFERPEAASTPLPRKKWSELKSDPGYTKLLADAYKQLVKSDARSGMLSFAALHCRYCAGGWSAPASDGTCPQNGPMAGVHSTWYFLPWHRAFTYFHERALGKAVNERTLRLPVWDWEHEGGLPDFYQTLGLPSFLNRLCARNSRIPPATVDDCLVQAWLFARPFADFCGQAPGQKKPSLPLASQGPHIRMHSLVGGAMEDMMYAAADPVFYSHHANVDRFWNRWMAAFPQDFPTEWLAAPMFLYDECDRLVQVTPRDMLDCRNLGYYYDDDPRSNAFDARVKSLDIQPFVDLLNGAGDFLRTVTRLLHAFEPVAQAAGQAAAEAVAMVRDIVQKTGFTDWLHRVIPLVPPSIRARAEALLKNLPKEANYLEFCVPCQIRINTQGMSLEPGKYYLLQVSATNGIFSNLGGFGVFSTAADETVAVVATLALSILKPVLYAIANDRKLVLEYGEIPPSDIGTSIQTTTIKDPKRIGTASIVRFDLLQ